MPPERLPNVLFGDVLALARERWVRELSRRLAARGFSHYARSDALVLRLLRGRTMTLGALATTMGVSRQTARKVITSLVERGYATVDISDTDARRRMVSLTGVGRTYTTTIIDEMTKLNEELSEKCDPADLVAAMSVLTFVKDNLGQ